MVDPTPLDAAFFFGKALPDSELKTKLLKLFSPLETMSQTAFKVATYLKR